MKKNLILAATVFLATLGCKKQEEERVNYDQGSGNVQRFQDMSQYESQYKAILAADPKNYEATVGLGNLYYDMGQPQKAVDMYEKALSIKPDDTHVRTDMGTMYRELGNPDRAIEEFRKVAALDPKHEQARYNLGVTLFYDKNDPKGAAEAWEEFLKINPNHPQAEALRHMIDQVKNPQAAAKPKDPSSGWVTPK